jgi:hypothetical protein
LAALTFGGILAALTFGSDRSDRSRRGSIGREGEGIPSLAATLCWRISLVSRALLALALLLVLWGLHMWIWKVPLHGRKLTRLIEKRRSDLERLPLRHMISIDSINTSIST